MEKTPVSILTEMMTKIGSYPTFEFKECPGVMPKMFEVKVTCDGVEATGQARSKKEAKQNAAKFMIEKLSKQKKIPASKIDNKSISPIKSISLDCKEDIHPLDDKYQTLQVIKV